MEIVFSKAVLVGLHLGFAIIGIDFLLWLAGEAIADPVNRTRMRIVSVVGLLGFIGSWIIGGYYYLVYYGELVKPIIKAGSAPWAHTVAMEAKEHIFLFLIPMAITVILIAWAKRDDIYIYKIRKVFIVLSFTVALIALSLGGMGYIISAAARWG